MDNIVYCIVYDIICKLTIYCEDGNAPLDEGPVNVQHYPNRHCIFANPHLGYLKGDQAICKE